MYDELVFPVYRCHAIDDVATHGYVEQDSVVGHLFGARGDAGFHDRLPVDVPHQASGAPALVLLLIPRKAVHVALWASHVMHVFLYGVMLVLILVERAPVQAGVVDAVAIPALEDVNFSPGRPVARLLRKHPECWPHSHGARRGDDSSHEAALPTERLYAYEPGAGV